MSSALLIIIATLVIAIYLGVRARRGRTMSLEQWSVGGRGFGTFLPRKRKARSGRNPVNGKEIRISAKTVPAFSAGQGFKEAVSDR